METYEMFALPSDHWTWIAVRELPFPHSGNGFVACCGRCGSLTYTPRATYELAWKDADRHHQENRDAYGLAQEPDRVRNARRDTGDDSPR